MSEFGIDTKSLPDPATMRRVLDAMVRYQPGSSTYRVMTAVMYYAGLRPSVVVMLRPAALTLLEGEWGVLDVLEADILSDESGEPKTGRRTVPIPPLRLYDCRHAAATTWLAAGVSLGEVARRLGHSVDVLVSTYVGALEGDEAAVNRMIEHFLDDAS